LASVCQTTDRRITAADAHILRRSKSEFQSTTCTTVLKERKYSVYALPAHATNWIIYFFD